MASTSGSVRDAVRTSSRAGIALALLAGAIHAVTIVLARDEIFAELEAALESYPEVGQFGVEELYYLTLVTAPPITVGVYLVGAVVFAIVYDRYVASRGPVGAYALAVLVAVGFSVVWEFRLPTAGLVVVNAALWSGFAWLFLRSYSARSTADDRSATDGVRDSS